MLPIELGFFFYKLIQNGGLRVVIECKQKYLVIELESDESRLIEWEISVQLINLELLLNYSGCI